MEPAEGATRHPRSEDHALPSIRPRPGSGRIWISTPFRLRERGVRQSLLVDPSAVSAADWAAR